MNALVLLLSALMFLMALSLFVWTRKQLQQFRDEIQQQSHTTALSSELTALNAGTIGLGERFIKMEKQVQQILVRLDEMDNQIQSESPYGYAIELAHKGYSAENIAELCHISSSEAELMVMLHRQGRAA